MAVPFLAWQSITASVLGAAHRRLGKMNQDAVGSLELPLGSMVAVADGHGSTLCVRSDRGSRLAVRSGFEAVGRMARAPGAVDHVHDIMQRITADAPRQIVDLWRRSVEEDIAREPLSQPDLEAAGPDSAERLARDPLLAYGTTLLLCLVSPRYVAFLQLGDGDTLTVAPGGEVGRPLPPDPRLIANETTSMSGDGAWGNFRTRIQDLSESPIDLILLSTDGYSNSFRDDADFLKVGADILANINMAGIEKVSETLPAWLQEATNRGSSDDISAALLVREQHSQSLGVDSTVTASNEECDSSR